MNRGLIGWVSLALVLGVLGQARAVLPEGWSSLDINTSGGRADEVDGTWVISGDGDDIWAESDAFNFAYRRLSGDCEIAARVVDNGSGSNGWAKGGVMIRETLAPGSKNALMAITDGEGSGLTFQNRPSTNGRSHSAHSSITAAPPHWVRLTRKGNTITGYSSINGVDWVQQPDGSRVDSTVNPVQIPMANDVYVGLAVTSHAAGQVRTYTFDNVTATEPRTATEPEPGDGAVVDETWVVVSWVPGSTAGSHDVYFGTSLADVSDGAGDTFLGNQHEPFFEVGLPASAYPDGLVRGTTYYWRIDEVEIDGTTKHKGDVWRFLVPSQQAYDPVPPDGAHFVTAPLVLTWTPGVGAERHTIHFGDDFEAVANSETGNAQSGTEYGLRSVRPDTTYYWRVDEFDGQTTHRGDVWSFTTCPAELAGVDFYYVDTGHPDARDSNPGTEAQPFKTIRKGVESVGAGDILLVKAGTYRETAILYNSGTEANPIQIWAYPGHEGRAVINAAEPVTNWQPCAGPDDCAGNPHWEHIWVADVGALIGAHPDSSFTIKQVFQHGQLLDHSRYPNAGWSYPTSIADPARAFADSTLSQPDGYFIGSVCHIKTALWQMDMIPITGFSRDVVTLARSPRFNIVTDLGYYITNIVGEINEEGEWAYDPAAKQLFLWPQDDVAHDVEITYRDYCLRTYDTASWTVVRGLAMLNAYEHGIWLYQANSMTIENNTVEHPYFCGIMVQATNGHCANNQILNNTVRHSAARGINVDGNASNNRIAGNTVYGTGTDEYGGDLRNGQSFAIYISGPFTEVHNNRIDRTGYSALYLDGSIYGRDVSYNYITNVALALSDGGGVYTGGYNDRPEKDYIHHNIVEDAIGCLTMSRRHDVGLPVTIERYSGDTPGIYVDEKGNNRIVEHNTVVNSRMAGIFFHWAPGNVVQNNTLYGNETAQIFFSGNNRSQEKLVDNIVLDNVMFATAGEQRTLYLGMNYDDVHFGQSDRNYFYNPYQDAHIRLNRYSTTGGWDQDMLTLRQWWTLSGYDANSREFGDLDRVPGLTLASPCTSRIVYNATLVPASIDVGDAVYCDVDGNRISGAVTLEPFESKILISAEFATSDLLQAGTR